MKTVNDAVQERLGRMIINLCEAEVFLSDREAKIAELEQENADLKRSCGAAHRRRSPQHLRASLVAWGLFSSASSPS
jgi:hypothetical protein